MGPNGSGKTTFFNVITGIYTPGGDIRFEGTSIVGLRPGPQPFPYAASKAAVVNLTKTMAGALGPAIRVNAVAPGWMVGDWMEQALGENYERLMERRAKLTPLKRCVTPDEVAVTIVNLIVSNPFVTGEVIVIDGGFSATT